MGLVLSCVSHVQSLDLHTFSICSVINKRCVPRFKGAAHVCCEAQCLNSVFSELCKEYFRGLIKTLSQLMLESGECLLFAKTNSLLL